MKHPSLRRLPSIARLFSVVVAALTLHARPVPAADDYQLGPDSMVQPGVPQGTVTKHSWKSEKVYPGTERDYWIYV
ncbi:MAG TPA: hypothetical protein VL475_01990, partial [Planctomycetaceae bacterium]|nr:hypothetical protein [Planctomycetaceae bacterium]